MTEMKNGKVREVPVSQCPSVPGPRTLIDLPHGGYRKLIAWRKSEVVYQGTVVFCRRFLPARGDRTVDQMVQAARSCKQNIAEGSASAGTSKETEIRLTGVDRASLDELREDYLDRLRTLGEAPWAEGDERSLATLEKSHAKFAKFPTGSWIVRITRRHGETEARRGFSHKGQRRQRG